MNGTKKHYFFRPEEQTVLLPEGTIPPLVSIDVFKRVQIRLEQNKLSSPRHNAHPETALLRGGLVRCFHCGGAMNVRNSRGGKRADYFCTKGNDWKRENNLNPLCKFNNIGGKLVDPVIWEKVLELMSDPKQLRESIAALKIPDPTAEERIPVASRLKKVNQELDNLLDMGRHASSKEALDKINAWIKQTEKEKERLLHEEELLENQSQEWDNAMKEVEKFEAWCQGFLLHCKEPTYKEKRRAIEMFGIRVHVKKFGLKPRLTIEVSPPSIVSVFASVQSYTDKHYWLVFLKWDID